MTEALTTTHANPLGDIERMAEYVAKSQLFQIKTKEQGVVLMLLCQAKGMHPMAAVERYHIFQGRHSTRADAMLAEFQQRGGTVEWLHNGDDYAEASFMPARGLAKPFVYRYTMEDAKREGLTGKDNWRKTPATMLRWRCITNGIRATDPGVNMGEYTQDEVESFNAKPEAVDVTPQKPASGRLSLATVTQAAPVVDAEVVSEPPTEPASEPEAAFPGEPEAPVYADPIDILKALKALKEVGVTSPDDLYAIFGGNPQTMEVDVDHTPISALEYARATYRKRAKKSA